MQRCRVRGAKVHVQRCRGAEVQMCRGAGMHQGCRDAEVQVQVKVQVQVQVQEQEHEQEQVQRCRGAGAGAGAGEVMKSEVHRCRDTEAERVLRSKC